ncbi:uncharacterized protein C1orf131 homolog [Saccostrea echinata]|uniref:uncharacterized protein C1orf131 homolog n=1 Tax=Saccostrea echinata TaxID=191078 RepID=UPI002A7EC01F|nr:uncharacterized protein C1orf131 homolog [Saccostrea echinata]
MESEMSDCLHEELLKRLDAYGESLMDNEDYENRVKHAKKIKKRKKILAEEDDISEKIYSKKRKKRKKNKAGNGSSPVETIVEEEQTKMSGKEKKKQQMKDELGLNDMDKSVMTLDMSVMNSDMSEDTKKPTNTKVVVYERPKSKRKEDETKNFIEKSQEVSTHVIDLKSARLDVQKFGIKGFSEEKKEAAMESLLVKLGAKPKKNKAHNYKEYQEMVKKQKVEEREKRELDRKLGYKVQKKVVARKKDRNDVGRVDGQVGKYKHGVQFVTKQDLQPGGRSVKKKRKKKF